MEKNSALNCEAYDTFFTDGSGHRILTAKLRLSLRQSKISTKRIVSYDWSKLLTDNNVKELYAVEVNNRFQTLRDLEENLYNSNTLYNNIISAHDEAEEAHTSEEKGQTTCAMVKRGYCRKTRTMLETLDYSNRIKTRNNAGKLVDAKTHN